MYNKMCDVFCLQILIEKNLWGWPLELCLKETYSWANKSLLRGLQKVSEEDMHPIDNETNKKGLH